MPQLSETPGVTFESDWYPSVEHAYQASRFEEPALRDKLRRAPTEGTARKWGGLWPTSTPGWEDKEGAIWEALLEQAWEDLDELI